MAFYAFPHTHFVLYKDLSAMQLFSFESDASIKFYVN